MISVFAMTSVKPVFIAKNTNKSVNFMYMNSKLIVLVPEIDPQVFVKDIVTTVC